MEITEFRKVVAAYLNRDVSEFTTDTDKVLLAINNAKLHAQRMHSFEFCRIQAGVTVSKTTGGDLSAAVLLGTATAVDLKQIERAYLQYNGATNYTPINFISQNDMVKRVQRRYEAPRDSRYNNQPVSDPVGFYSLVQQGETIRLYPWNDTDMSPTTATVALDAVRWLLPYAEKVSAVQPAGTVDTDFLMKYCTDWLLYRSIIELNYFLKEDQRVAISRGTMEVVWQSVLDWDNGLVASKDDGNLLD